MKNNFKNIFRTGAMALAGLLAFASCSDTWDDHYDTSSTTGYNGTTLNYIASQSDLSDFLEVARAAGYDRTMADPQVMTIFAPVNGSFDKQYWLDLIASGEEGRKEAITRFLQNHVARYNHSYSAVPVAAGEEAEPIYLLNEKPVEFGDFSVAGTHVDADRNNISCNNGIVHVIPSSLVYRPNLFEYIKDEYKARLEADPEVANLHTLYGFLKRFDVDSLDVNRSVAKGYDEDGNTIYSDSVMIRNNRALINLGALLYREDSLYNAIIPSPEVYDQCYNDVKNYFKFNVLLDDKQAVRDSIQDYFANYYTSGLLFYNMKMNVNRDNPEEMPDSLYSTIFSPWNWQYNVFYKDQEAADHNPVTKDYGRVYTSDLFVGEGKECSNGKAYAATSLPFTKYDSFFKTIHIEGENLAYQVKDDGFGKSNTQWRVVNCSGDSISKSSCLRLASSQSMQQWMFTYEVPNTLSGKYDIYIRVLPKSVDPEPLATDANDNPCQFRASLYVRDNKGVMPTKSATQTFYSVPASKDRNFTNSASKDKITDIFIGTCDLSECFLNLNSGVYLKLESYSTGTNSKFTKTLYIDYIEFRPHVEETANAE